MSSLQKVILERTSLYQRYKSVITMIPKPTNHFPKYQRIEVASLFQDFKTQKDVFRAFARNNHFVKCVRISRTVSSFQIVRPPKSHSGTHIDTTIGISTGTPFKKLKSFL